LPVEQASYSPAEDAEPRRYGTSRA
jgi:hypothetical protein